MSKLSGRDRARTPVTLADQLMAWARYRAGDSTSAIAAALHRQPAETRAILWGRNER